MRIKLKGQDTNGMISKRNDDQSTQESLHAVEIEGSTTHSVGPTYPEDPVDPAKYPK